jgi:mono/diheme cytochrome c family protein
MKTLRWPLAGLLALGAWLGAVALTAGPEVHGMGTIKKAKELGITSVTNCQSCHIDKLPKKGETPHLNDQGKWLQEQKTSRKAKEVDVAWLKEYTPAPK